MTVLRWQSSGTVPPCIQCTYSPFLHTPFNQRSNYCILHAVTELSEAHWSLARLLLLPDSIGHQLCRLYRVQLGLLAKYRVPREPSRRSVSNIGHCVLAVSMLSELVREGGYMHCSNVNDNETKEG